MNVIDPLELQPIRKSSCYGCFSMNLSAVTTCCLNIAVGNFCIFEYLNFGSSHVVLFEEWWCSALVGGGLLSALRNSCPSCQAVSHLLCSRRYIIIRQVAHWVALFVFQSKSKSSEISQANWLRHVRNNDRKYLKHMGSIRILKYEASIKICRFKVSCVFLSGTPKLEFWTLKTGVLHCVNQNWSFDSPKLEFWTMHNQNWKF